LNKGNTLENNNWDVEAIVADVCFALDREIPRSAVYTTVIRLLEKYDDALIKIYVPLLVRREATLMLRRAVFQEIEGAR
jgi:hypothetical protein